MDEFMRAFISAFIATELALIVVWVLDAIFGGRR